MHTATVNVLLFKKHLRFRGAYHAYTREVCRVIGHVPRPLYMEEDGHVDDHICHRCGELV